MSEFIIEMLLISSVIVSLFFLLNRSAFFSKLGINNIQLVRMSEQRNQHLILSFLFLVYPIIKIINGDEKLNILYGIEFSIIGFILMFELLGFPGIFKSINDPEFVEFTNLDQTTQEYLEIADVIGVEIGGVARAYPVEPLQMNHVVNDNIGDLKFAITHCALCNSSHVFNRTVNHKDRIFHAAVPIIRSNLVLADQDANLWQQLTGEGLAGNAVGHDLKIIPSITTSWNNWKRLHPNTTVLNYKHKRLQKIGNIWFSKLLGNIRNKDRSPLFPTGNNDIRYSPKAPIIGLITNKIPVALPLEKIPDIFDVNISINSSRIFIFQDRENGLIGAFYNPIDDVSGPHDLQFEFELNEIVSNSHRWDIYGTSLTKNNHLKPVKLTFPLYWFAWIGTYPNSLIIENITETFQIISVIE